MCEGIGQFIKRRTTAIVHVADEITAKKNSLKIENYLTILTIGDIIPRLVFETLAIASVWCKRQSVFY